MSPTFGPMPAAPTAGKNAAPAFGGGFTPRYGPFASFTAFGGNPIVPVAPPPSSVEAFPELNTAAYTVCPSGLTASARGSSALIATSNGAAARFAGSNTCTVLACEHDTNARCGVPANTTSLGSSLVLSVYTTLRLVRSTTLTESEMLFTTHTCVLVRARTEIGSSPTGISLTNGTLHGTVNPMGASTTAYYDYGLTTNYGSSKVV